MDYTKVLCDRCGDKECHPQEMIDEWCVACVEEMEIQYFSRLK